VVSEQVKANGEAAKRFFGVWRYVGSTVDGKPVPGRGANPKGIIYYDPSGHMVVQVAPDTERKRAGSTPTPDEAQAALAGYVAYFGTYSIDERARTVTHHRQGSVQPGDVADLVRGYEFAGDRLILRPPGTTHEVVWERIK
jgi:Lipocalin-like domain